MKKKRNIIIVVVVILLIALFFFFKNGDDDLDYVVVERENITREIFETGTVKKGEVLSASFSESGKINSVLVEEGSVIKKGDVLASLDIEQLEIMKNEAEAVLDSAEAGLGSVLKGATDENIEVAEAGVSSVETALSSAKENLENTISNNEETLKTAYIGVPYLLSTIHKDVKEVKEGVDDVVDRNFTEFYFSETYSVRDSRTAIRKSETEIEKYKEMITEEEISFSEKDEGLLAVEDELKAVLKELDNILNISENDSFYEERISSDDIDDLRSFQATVNSDLSSIISLRQSISSTKTEINSLLALTKAEVSSLEKSLTEAEKALDQVKSGASTEDVIIKEAVIRQAEASISRLEKRIQESVLTSPVDGIVSVVHLKEEETAVIGTPVFSIIPEEEFQIEVFIYEGDVPEVSIGNKVDISLVAFPDIEFQGEVISINFIGEVIDGVVYYKTIVSPNDYPEKTMVNMTADVTILTAKKEGVLSIPERVTFVEDVKRYFEVINN
ncbi:MAG: HlyD family efflux transporter periplasmic adaptor subunit [Patescibacteria group bacterium]|jgi:multidrug resistance efflux pump|nr:HlyD family efflux transporter periplasmic adaptor subunit [Patescibacteria group bacterium]